jgi:hypothetical protein
VTSPLPRLPNSNNGRRAANIPSPNGQAPEPTFDSLFGTPIGLP